MNNVTKLILHKISVAAIPAGGGISDGIRFLADPQTIKMEVENAAKWVKRAIQLVREATEPNPWRAADDEAIAGEILRKIQEKKSQKNDNPR